MLSTKSTTSKEEEWKTSSSQKNKVLSCLLTTQAKFKPIKHSSISRYS